MAGSWNGLNYYGDSTNETVHGSTANEYLSGAEGDDNLFGEGGNDTFDGGVGSDSLDGGIGNDTLIDVGSIPGGFSGIIGRDTLRGGEGDDVLDFRSADTGDFAYGDAGNDTIRLDFRSATETQRVTFRVAPNTVVKLNDANTVGVSSVERVSFLGGKGDDFVVGGDLDDTLVGGLGSYGFGADGADVLRGMGGNDSIDGGTGIQRIDGGDGTDTASFNLAEAGVALRIVSGALINLGAWGAIQGVENLGTVTTSIGNDILSIDQANHVSITSGDGADRVTVGGGGGSVYAGQGGDVVRMGAAGDYVDPGSGADTVYLGAGSDVSQNADRNSTEADRIHGEAGNDYIYSSAGADRLDGGADHDVLYAGGGADTVLGGEGNDQIQGEGGADFIDGGAGDDVISGEYAIENDVIRGGEGSDRITGGLGLDALNGGLGDDELTLAVLLGGGTFDTQVDQLNGAQGIDTLGIVGPSSGASTVFDVTLGTTTDVLLDGQLVATASSVERLNISAYGNGDHQITGGRFDDVVRTGQGDDVITTLGGNDYIQGLDYDGVDSNTILTGTGDDTANIYLGGNDSVNLEAGDDALTLSNVYSNPAGLSSYEGGVGTDTLTVYTRFGFAGVSFDGAAFRSGATVIGDATGFEKLVYYGSSDVFDFNGLVGDDRVELGAADDTAFGQGGNDTLLGGAGSDVLGGGAGDDALTGGAGRDNLAGDGGSDTFIYTAIADSATGPQRDTITDFAAGTDVIGLAAIDARTDLFGDQTFAWRGTSGFSGGLGEVRYGHSGGNTVVQADLNGDRTSDLTIALSGVAALADTDFLL